MADFRIETEPDRLLRDHLHLFTSVLKQHAILDLACGGGHNGIFLAKKGFPVVFADRAEEALEQVRDRLAAEGMAATLWHVDLEMKDVGLFSSRTFSAVLVFRYLHRPLIPAIRQALMPGGILAYETFTTDQARFGKPKNPAHLLKPGELFSWFRDWEVLYAFEGITGEPQKAIAQLVCRKP